MALSTLMIELHFDLGNSHPKHEEGGSSGNPPNGLRRSRFDLFWETKRLDPPTPLPRRRLGSDLACVVCEDPQILLELRPGEQSPERERALLSGWDDGIENGRPSRAGIG